MARLGGGADIRGVNNGFNIELFIGKSEASQN